MADTLCETTTLDAGGSSATATTEPSCDGVVTHYTAYTYDSYGHQLTWEGGPNCSDLYLARRTAQRVRKLLEQRAEQQDGAEPSGWTVCCAASDQGLSLFGARAGQPPLRLIDPSQARPDEPIAIVDGFNVHAARTLHYSNDSTMEFIDGHPKFWRRW